MNCPICDRNTVHLLGNPGWYWCIHCKQEFQAALDERKILSWKELNDREKNTFVARELLECRVNNSTGAWYLRSTESQIEQQDFVGDRNAAQWLINHIVNPSGHNAFYRQERFVSLLMQIVLKDEHETTTMSTIFSGNTIRDIRTNEVFALVTASPSNLMLALLRFSAVDIDD